MFLKSLEIRGFKSFAEKTELVFKKGITAIVGPNGSGKSNILDAVKWVLGEQSIKNLRGGKMQDVIFSGTEYRKPVGLAQVTLVLDNSDEGLPIDYSEVTIMRRLFRSGESEYYINGTKCRLKDIQELFMDTGIGKEGYSIIGQGKIEALLNGRPEERRSLLEEAAGIVKFKTRKQEAEKRLENTENNLQRIEDIFSTYEDRIEPLKLESDKAKTFLEISKKLKEKEVTLILNNIDKCKEKINSTKEKIEETNIKLNDALKKKSIHKENVDNLNKKLEEFELENNEKTKEYYDSKTKKQNIINENNLLEERISNLKRSIDKYKENLYSLKEKLKKLTNNKLEEEKKLSDFIEKQILLENNILEFKKLIGEKNDTIKQQLNFINETKAYQVELLSNISKQKNETIILKNDINNLELKKEDAKSSVDAYSNSIKINNSTKEVLKKEITKIDEKIQSYEDHIRKYTKEMSSRKRELSILENKFKENSRIYSRMEAQCNALINLEKQHEGFNKSVKNLIQYVENQNIKNAKDKVHILGEIIKVDKNYEIAIEIALGSSISHVITENEIIAKNLIKYLKNNNMGRATFLPLNIIKGKTINISDKIKNIEGFIGIASELIKYDKKYLNAMKYTLGRTVIAKDMDSALNIAKESGYSYKIVTLNGDIVNPGGALTGGSLYHKGSNIIGRKREIEELKENINKYSEIISVINENVDELKSKIKILDENSINLKDEIHYENLEKTKISGKINAIDGETEKLKRDLKTESNELILIEQNLENSFKTLKLKNSRIQELNKLQEENSLKITNFENQLKSKEKEIASRNQDIVTLKIDKAKVDESIINLNRESKRLDEDIKGLEEEVKNLKNDISKSDKEVLDSLKKISYNKSQIVNIEKIILKFEEKFKDIEIRRIKIKEEIKINNSDLETISIMYNNIDKTKNSLEINLARYETEERSIYAKLNDEMELTYAEALEFKSENQNIDECREYIQKYKNQISELGLVNLGAIEEYKEVMGKYTFMKEQKEDLVKAKDELLSVVLEMTNKMKTVFHENFNKLKVNFNETFKELFKGGKADLILDSDDELTSNIEINVQPPGKKLQNINLMSGGEKGLAAIALLFAILKMKPTPFCILDEIEAALDDSNVLRYSEFLKKFSDNTQFIIITHRKGSMEACDVLYGVTMEEKGISKVVSVDLSE